MCPGSTITSVQNPYGEVDYKTSGGTDSYNAHAAGADPSVGERRRVERAVHATRTARALPAARTRRERRATRRASRRSGRRTERTSPTGTLRIRLQPVRRPPHVQPERSSTPLRAAGALKGGWSFGGIMNARSGLPLEVQIARNDIVYVDGAGKRVQQPGGRPHRGGQHAGRRIYPERPASGSRPRRRSVHQGRRAPLPESGRVRDAEARDQRQPRAQLDPRTELLAGRCGDRQADWSEPRPERRAAPGDLQHLQPQRTWRASARTLPNALPSATA